MRFLQIAVEGFEVELELTEMLGLEAAGFEFEGGEAIQPAMKKEQVEREVAPADLRLLLKRGRDQQADASGGLIPNA